MAKPHSLPVLVAILAGCSSTPTAQHHAAMYAVLDPATGVTYHVPLRYDLRAGLYSMASPGPTRASASTSLDEYVFRARESTDTGRDEAVTVATVALVGGLSPVSAIPDVTMRTALKEPARAPGTASRVEREVNEVAAPSRVPAQSLNLKLDTEFASAKRLVRFALGVASLGPVGKLAIAELVPWAKQAEKVHVRGGADLSGNAERNRELAIARATAVSTAFVAAGVDREKISKSSCIDCYVAPNGTEQGRRINRRVDVELVLKKELYAQLPPPVHALKAPDSTSLIHATALR